MMPIDSPGQSTSNENTIASDTVLAASTADSEQMVVFKLENEEYAAPILEVQEIIPTGDITPFPNVPAYISGIINVRGTVATVINLAKRFSLNRSTGENVDKYVILTRTDKALFGITVDEVTSVMRIPKNNIRSAAGMGESKIHAEYVNGVAVVDERVILILDFAKILNNEESLETPTSTSTPASAPPSPVSSPSPTPTTDTTPSPTIQPEISSPAV